MVVMESQFSIQNYLPFLQEKHDITDTLQVHILVVYLPGQKCFDFEKQMQNMQ